MFLIKINNSLHEIKFHDTTQVKNNFENNKNLQIWD
jgi:hypothetical protein